MILLGGKKQMKKIVYISGSTGFIGSHLVKTLSDRDIEIVRIPREFLYFPVNLKKLFKRRKPDYIYHLAAYGNIANQKEISEIFKANLICTFNLLQAVKDIHFKTLINVSTSSVLLPHQTIYSATKFGAEQLCKAFFDEYHKPIITVRPFSVIGKGEQKSHLIPKLIKSCLNGEKMPFNPYPVHDFIDVRDLIEGIEMVIKNENKFAGKAIGIGTGIQRSNQEVLEIVEKITKKKANLEFIDNIRSYDTQNWYAKNDDIKINKYSLQDTINDMLNSRT